MWSRTPLKNLFDSQITAKMEKEGPHTKIAICDKLNKAKKWFEGAEVRWVKMTYHAQLYTPPISPFTVSFVGSESRLIAR